MPAEKYIALLSDEELLKRLAPPEEFPEKLSRLYGMVRSAISEEDPESFGHPWIRAALLAYARVVKAVGQDGVQWNLDFMSASSDLIGEQLMPLEAEGDSESAVGADNILRSLFPDEGAAVLNPAEIERIEFLSVFAEMSEPHVLETEAAARFL